MPRPLGSPNIVTREARERINALLAETYPDALYAMKTLLASDPKEGLKYYTALNKIVAPYSAADTHMEIAEFEEEKIRTWQIEKQNREGSERFKDLREGSERNCEGPEQFKKGSAPSIPLEKEADPEEITLKLPLADLVDYTIAREGFNRATIRDYEPQRFKSHEPRIQFIQHELESVIARRILDYRAWPGNTDPDWQTKDYRYEPKIWQNLAPQENMDLSRYPSSELLAKAFIPPISGDHERIIQETRWMTMKMSGIYDDAPS